MIIIMIIIISMIRPTAIIVASSDLKDVVADIRDD